MPEFDDRFDDRLRTALGALGDAAEQRVRPAGAAAVPAAGRRRRRTVRSAGAALALVLAGGVATGWWLVRDAAPADRVAAPGCAPAIGTAFLPHQTTDEVRARVGTVLAGSPGVGSVDYESREEAYRRFAELYRDSPDLVESVRPDSLPESWRFTLRCAADFPAVAERLAALPDVTLVCSCDPPPSSKPSRPGD
jgi:cell division protein FtsX